MAKTLEFKATVSRMVAFEKATGLSLMKAFDDANMSMTTIVELVKALSNATDDDIDEYVKENGVLGLTTALTDSLVDSGFLPKKPGK